MAVLWQAVYAGRQAHKANLDFRIGRDFVPETADASLWDD